MGQDPYPTPGHPVGLSFSVAPHVRPIPRSLQNIYAELQADLGIRPAASGDLNPWFQQGVLLLNRVLTVQPGRSGSHRGKGWEQVTQRAIEALVVAARWWRSCGGGMRSHSSRCSARSPTWRAPTHHRCPQQPDSSGHDLSAAPTSYWSGLAASRSTGGRPRTSGPAQRALNPHERRRPRRRLDERGADTLFVCGRVRRADVRARLREDR